MHMIGKASIKGRAYLIKLLLASGVYLEAKTEDGHSTLTIAASSGIGDAVRRLLEKGASSQIIWAAQRFNMLLLNLIVKS